ncbi:MAG: hypothetical protein K940chlam3_00825 [Chlamydiae bacterium]|nr:hypothetical protein [Chlamydiota bacterium]
MFHLENTFLELFEALENSKSLILNEKGYWRFDKSVFNGVLNKFYPVRQLKRVAESCIQNFKRIERIPIDSKNYDDVSHMSYQTLSQYLEKKLRKYPQCHDLLRELMRHRVGFEHRFGGKNGGASRLLMGYVEYRLLGEMARRWKEKQDVFRLQFLTQYDEERLKFAAQYPLFVDLVLEYPSLQENFFSWVLRDDNPVDVFIEFPGITEWIITSDLSNRLGRVGDQVRLEKIHGEKHVTIKFEGKRESILDPEKMIEFRGGYRLSLNQIFEVFSQKYFEVGNLEVFSEGVTNWNSFKMGHWDEDLKDYVLIDFIKDDWWNQLPHFETITKKQAEERYEIPITDGQWIVSAHATRGNINLSYEKTHAFVQIAVPTDRGSYKIYDFGKYGMNFPRNILEGLKMFTQTMLAGVMYPDENVYYTDRQHGYYPVHMTPEEGRNLMQLIREEIFNCFAGRRVYQIESDNCARWTFELFAGVLGEGKLPNLYQMSLLDCEPGGPIQKLFYLIKKLPKWLHAFSITRLHYPIGAWRGIWVNTNDGRAWKSLSNHKFFETAEVYLPALVIHKRRGGLFSFETANLENKTLWNSICEKVLRREMLLSASAGQLMSKLAHNLLFYIRRRLLIQSNLEDDNHNLQGFFLVPVDSA